MTQLHKNILETIGNTPLLELEDGIFAKAEFMNPSGSIKARMANYIIEKAEQEGLLKPGDTIVESTSGNTGNALSMIAAVKGYKMIVMIPAGYTNERVQISRGFGASVRFVGNFQVNEAREAALKLGQEEGYYCPAQFDNEWNVDENRDWLGMEPTESKTLACCMVADHKIEGISDGFVPTIYARHRDEIDGIISVESNLAIVEAQRLASEKGLFVGPSSGANYWAAKKIKEDYPEIKTVLTLLCDRGEKYLSMMYA